MWPTMANVAIAADVAKLAKDQCNGSAIMANAVSMQSMQ